MSTTLRGLWLIGQEKNVKEAVEQRLRGLLHQFGLSWPKQEVNFVAEKMTYSSSGELEVNDGEVESLTWEWRGAANSPGSVALFVDTHLRKKASVAS